MAYGQTKGGGRPGVLFETRRRKKDESTKLCPSKVKKIILRGIMGGGTGGERKIDVPKNGWCKVREATLLETGGGK